MCKLWGNNPDKIKNEYFRTGNFTVVGKGEACYMTDESTKFGHKVSFDCGQGKPKGHSKKGQSHFFRSNQLLKLVAIRNFTYLKEVLGITVEDTFGSFCG